MPAENIMVNQPARPNAGDSSSLPSRMRPYRPSIIHSANTRKPVAAST